MIAPLLLATTLAAAPAPRLGTDVAIREPTHGPVIGLFAQVHIDSEVEGDVVVLGGDAVIGETGRVNGDVVSVGGRVRGAARASGRAISLATLDAIAFPPLGETSSARSAWGVRLLRVGGWLILATLVLLAWPRQVRRGGDHLRARPTRTLAVGVLSLGVWLVVVLLALALSATRFGMVVLLAGVAVLLAAKVLGLLAVAWLVGLALRPLLTLPYRAEIPRTGIGMAALAIAGLLPLLGATLWLVANVAGIGAIVAAALAPRLAASAAPTS